MASGKDYCSFSLIKASATHHVCLLSFIACIQERGYVVKSGRTLIPTPLGRLLTAYLTIHFTEYVDVNFTAKVEEQLDEVSGEF